MSDTRDMAASNAGRLVGRIFGMIQENDRGSLATLRRGRLAACPIVFPLIGETDNRPHVEDVGLVIGQAMGIRRDHNPGCGNFGRSMRFMWLSRGKTDGMKIRASRIIQARPRDRKMFNRKLISMIRWMATANIPIDFFRLYMDVYFWNEKTARSWASAFYAEDVE